MKKIVSSNCYKWIALAIIWGAVFFQQGVRQIYGATIPLITESLDVSSVEIGFVGTVFTFVYGATVLCAGFLSDLISRKWVLVSGVLLFGVGGFISGFAGCVGALVVSYGILNGLGQPLVFPPGMSLMMQLHGENTRATALSVMQSAVYIGIVVCAIGSGHLAGMSADGWRTAFIVVGGLALVWVLVMSLFMENTKSVSSGTDRASLKEALAAVASKRSALLYGAYLVILNGVTIGFTIWTPSFIRDVFPDLTMRDVVLHAVLWMYIGAVLGVMFGGRLGDSLALRRNGSRLEILAAGVAGCGIAWYFVAESMSLVGCCTALACCGFFRGMLDSNLNVAFFDVIKPRYHASALGFMLGISYILGSFAPVMLCWIRQHSSLRDGLMPFPVFYAVALVLVLVSRFCYYIREREPATR
jgi:MFS family permease